jgi:TRAP-type mannitol/chloroaromatic compound transport system substrate-binding protein
MAEADYVFAEFNARNNQALSTLVNEHGVELRRFPDDVLTALRRYSGEVMEEIAAANEAIGRVYGAYRDFADNIAPWIAVSRRAHMDLRDLA